MRESGLEVNEHDFKTGERNINNLCYADGTSLIAKSANASDESQRAQWKYGTMIKTKLMAAGWAIRLTKINPFGHTSVFLTVFHYSISNLEDI